MPKTPEETAALTFPCEFVIKVFGTAASEFQASVLAIIQKHIPELRQEAMQSRPSRDGTYQALSITITATSRAQLDAIYHDLVSHPLVLMAL